MDTAQSSPGSSGGSSTRSASSLPKGYGPSRGRPNSAARRFLLIAYIVSPLAVLAFLIWMISLALQGGTVMRAPPVGAGAGRTGMSNEFMGIGKQADQPAATPNPATPGGSAGPGGTSPPGSPSSRP